ncbi:MAG: SBBP repeat-containing protein, partial [Candidatus Binatia bacterium]
VTVYSIGFLALDPKLLFADSAKSLPNVTVASRVLAPRTPGLSGVRNRFPLYFVENRGQVDTRAAYYIHGADKVLYFGSAGVTMVLSKPVVRQSARADFAGIALGAAANHGIAPGSVSRAAVMLEFIGADPTVQPVGEDLAKARFSYFKGPRENWAVGLQSYTRLVYADLWPGIDLIYTASVDRLKYMFVVKPGANPGRIKLRYRGAESISLNNDGKLVIRTAVEDFHDERPTAHQELNGTVQDVNAEYVLLSSESDAGYSYGFNIGVYDATKALVIDPAILVYSGFIGGTGDDRGNGIAVDSDGSAYITGETNSLQASFPVAGGLDVGQNGGVDAFVAKVDPTGTLLLYAGFIGGTGDDRGKSIAVDSLGNAYVTGETSSDQTSFPATIGPDVTYNGAIDAFVAKINPAGTNLVYAGYIGGLSLDRAMGVAVDSSNRAYVTGETASSGASFPNGAGFGSSSSFDSSHNGGLDAFVARVAATGALVEYAGYIGGVGTDRGISIAVDSLNRAYITGETDSSSASFPNGIGFAGLTSFDSSINGVSDAFVARVGADGQSLSYAGYIGGSGADKGNGVVVDGDGNAYVTGETSSDEISFPGGNGLGGLPGPGQVQKGGVDAFGAKINGAGTALLYAGYIGGTADDRGNAIALMPGCASNCEVYITGETSSVQSSFPVSDGPDLTHNGGVDAFIAKIEPDGSLGLAGYVGGTGDDRGKGIAVDAVGGVYLTGETNSIQPTFPLKGALDSTQNFGFDAFVAKFCVTGCVDLRIAKSDSPDPATVGASVTYTITVINDGPDSATDVELTDVLPAGVGLVSVTPTAGACAGSSTIVCDLGDLANGASATVTIVVNISAAGKLTNSATVSSAESDTDPSNNVEQEQTLVTLPDLTVKSLSAVAAAIPGSSVVVNDTTNNKGKIAAGPSVTRFFLSTNSKFDGTDTPLPGGSRPIPALSPKQSSSGSTTVTIPLATPRGRYFLVGVADADTGIPETKEKNAKARSITVALPDLIVQSLRGPKSTAAGSSIAVTDTIRNNAPVGAGASTTQYHLSSDALFDGGDALIGSRSVPALGAQGRNSGSATVTIPLGTTPGAYFILSVSDGAGAVAEAAEGNNLRAKSITVTP